jgi:HlyD family secretion protein
MSEPPSRESKRVTAAAIAVAVIIVIIVAASLWYLVQPQPLLVQGEADSTRIDIAARVDGRIREIPVNRGDTVRPGATLIVIDNPELVAKYAEAQADQQVAEAELARINAGTRQEEIDARKAQVESAEAALLLARQTYDRVRQLAATNVTSQQKLDEATDALQVAQRGEEQAKFLYQEAMNGFTREEHGIAEAKVKQAQAAVATLKSLVDQLTVVAPITGQVYQINTERGEVVAPGVPLLTLIDLDDIWLGFDLREDLMSGLKLGDHLKVRVPALANREITVELRVIASKGEYAGWRATRATGDFDLRTFAVRAYPVEKIPELRPGMSAYANWPARQ